MARTKKDAITSDMFRMDRSSGAEFVDVSDKKKKGMKLFVSPHQKQGFKVPLKDSDGKPLPLLQPGTNRQVFINGRPVYAMRDCNFKAQSTDIKHGCLSYYEATDQDEIDILTTLAADPSTEILTEEAYHKSKNPENFRLTKTVEEKEEIIDSQKNVIAELEDRIKKLTGE